MGLTFQQRPQLTHQCINFRTRNSRQDLQQAVDALLLKGAIERVTTVTSLGYYSQLFLVPKKTGDLCPVIDLSHSQPSYGSATLQDGDTGIRTCSHQKSRVDSVHRYPRRISTCPDAPSRPEVSALCGQQDRLPIDQSHRCGRRYAACREPVGSYDKTTRTAICFEHKTQYLLIRAPYTRIVVFWHISNIPPMASQSQISCNTPAFCIAAIFVKYCYTTGSWLL